MEVEKDKQHHTLLIKHGIIGNKQKRLILDSDYISFEENLIPTVFNKEEISEIRYGIIRKSFFFFEFQIFVKTKNDDVIKVSFFSVFKAETRRMLIQLNQITEIIYNLYFEELIKKMIFSFQQGESIEICNVIFEKERIVIISDGFIKENQIEINWDDAELRAYKSHFSIYSKKNAQNVNKKFTYLEDWNSPILYTFFITLKRHYEKNTIV